MKNITCSPEVKWIKFKKIISNLFYWKPAYLNNFSSMRYMGIFFFSIFLCFIFSSQLPAQNNFITIQLSYRNKKSNFNKFPFNKIVVFDNRPDTTKFRIEPDLQKYQIDKFNLPTNQAIKSYLEAAIKGVPQNNKTLYVTIKQLRFGNIRDLSMSLIFAVEAYYQGNDGYRKLTSLSKVYSFKKSFIKTITMALNEFLKEVNRAYYDNKIIGTNNYLLTDIDKNITMDWVSYPIYTQSSPVNGIYNSFDDFRNNKIQPADFMLGLASDSTYRISFKESNGYYNKEKNSFQNIWAISYNGDQFLPILGKCFLPLIKVNNRLYFYVPHSLPDMHTIIISGYSVIYSNEDSGVGGVTFGTHQNQMMYNNNLKVAILGNIIAFIQDMNSGTKKRNGPDNKTTNKKVTVNEMRYCFLDMDNGDIIY